MADSTGYIDLYLGDDPPETPEPERIRLYLDKPSRRAMVIDEDGMVHSMGGGAALLTKLTTFDLTLSTRQDFTIDVPTGFDAYPMYVLFANPTGAVTVGAFSLGYNANANDVVAAAVHALSGSGVYSIITAMAGAQRGTSGDTFGVKCSVTEAGPLTAELYVFGYLVPA